MKNLIYFLLPALFFINPPAAEKIVSCGPEIQNAVYAEVSSVRDGDWFNGATWSTGRVPAETDNITISHFLYSNNKNVIIRGKLSAVKGGIEFRGIDNKKFVGSGMGPDETPGDIGLWVMDAGQLDLRGEPKKSWTNLTGSATKGAKTITVKDASGWRVGDVIFIVPTDMPTNDENWGNDNAWAPIQPFANKFERRTITSISGNTVSFAQALVYDHNSVSMSDGSKTWTAEVGNLTRSIKIRGTTTGKAHIFIRSTKPQNISFVEGRYLGANNFTSRNVGGIINGRYGLHFHHCMDGSNGSVVNGNAFYDLGNRGYVPHMSNGIDLTNNISFSLMGESFWWDFQDETHGINLDGNLAALRLHTGQNGGTTGFSLGQGDGNRVTNNVSVYTHWGDQHQQGAYAWNADDVGVWTFKSNISHSNINGLFVWQNVNDNHVNEDYQAYNNRLAMHHGAYINEYVYLGGYIYKSLLSFEATQGNKQAMFQRINIDAGGNPYAIIVHSSPVPAGQSNVFQECKITGYSQAAINMATLLFVNENGKKIVDLVKPTLQNDKVAQWAAGSMYGSYVRVQPVSGQSYQVTQSGRSNIAAFAPTVYGTGDGLNAKYYNGPNHNSFAFERIDPSIRFKQWSYDKGASPNGVHHWIAVNGPYSVTYDGFYRPQQTGPAQFAFISYGGVRLTVDDRLILNRWTESESSTYIDAPIINLEVGRQYKIKVEHFNTGGRRGFEMHLKRNGVYADVPMSQLYSNSGGVPPVDTPVNKPPAVYAGPDVVTSDTIYKVEGSASDPDNNLLSVQWAGPEAVTLLQDQSDAAHVRVKVSAPGTYTLKLTAQDKAGLTANDEMQFTYQKEVDTVPRDTLKANAGPDQVIKTETGYVDGSASKGVWKTVNWTRDSGPGRWDPSEQNNIKTAIKYMQPGVHVIKLKLTDAAGKTSEDRVNITVVAGVSFTNKVQTGSNTCIDGTVLTYTVPAGKYSAVTQATADAMAIQELNTELAKCPLPWFTALLPSGKTLYLFGTESEPKIIIK